MRSLGRTLKRWRSEITAWHACHFTNGPSEAMTNLIKRIKRVSLRVHQFSSLPRARSALCGQARLVAPGDTQSSGNLFFQRPLGMIRFRYVSTLWLFSLKGS